jgi:hypothetical protein
MKVLLRCPRYFPPPSCSAIDYRYYVQRIPFVDYNSKQMDPLLSEEEVLREGGVHHTHWRLQRKRYSVRVEFEQAGSLGTSMFKTAYFNLLLTLWTFNSTLNSSLNSLHS